ncbi:hypothetical protein [Flavobacterium wongokense]|uniref:hypothetical protein n=1 Tax=Flavobacterium wongokense TaxID=2910674 RepID=UPI001F19843D|nr:hypothetical protein [Flavobacterium sp. WG47]MCF6131113.1 hypothetical protein [Flavobacterium sp. WG47]
MKKQNKTTAKVLFNLDDYKKSVWDLDRFRKDFLAHLGNNKLFEYDNLDEIIYHSLEMLHPINKKLKNTEKSIEQMAGVVLDHFRHKNIKEASIYRIGDGVKELVSTSKDIMAQPYKKRYLEHILRLKKVPKPIYEDLKNDAETHLLNINQNIQYYTNLKFIKEFKEKDKKPSNHSERTCLDYYFRCNEEQQKIIDFIFGGGLKERAIAKSTLYPISIPTSFILGHYDFPYYSAYEYSRGYFNHNLIDKCGHRLTEFPMDNENSMEKLYESDKRKFYKLYFRKYDKNEVFREIDYHLSLLPLSTDRKAIIEELKYLINRKRWISFYGLALSQIEGIFSEMLKYINSNKISEKSLFYKVNSLRDFYNLSTYYFDYFQYHIPELRNKYSHGVLDGGEKENLNSFDLLLDIKFLLKVFTELESPYIRLSNIVLKQDYQINTIDDVSIMFDLINALKPEHRKELKEKLDAFFKMQLIENCHLEYLLYSVSEDINNRANSLKEAFDKTFAGKVSLSESSYIEMKEYFNDEKNIEILNDEMRMYDTQFENYHLFNVFYKNYNKKLPKLNVELRKLIEKVFKTDFDLLNKSSLLFSLMK